METEEGEGKIMTAGLFEELAGELEAWFPVDSSLIEACAADLISRGWDKPEKEIAMALAIMEYSPQFKIQIRQDHILHCQRMLERLELNGFPPEHRAYGEYRAAIQACEAGLAELNHSEAPSNRL